MIGKGPHGGPVPERPQCSVFSPRSSIQCVMEEGHEPFGSLAHNFGGLGPYTPSVPDLAAASRGEHWVQRWAYDGVVLNARDGGIVSLADLKEFVAVVERLDDDAQANILVHRFGLRATRSGGDGAPRLDWRDWD